MPGTKPWSWCGCRESWWDLWSCVEDLVFLLWGRDRRWLELCPNDNVRPKLDVCFVWVFLLLTFCQSNRSGAGFLLGASEVVMCWLFGVFQLTSKPLWQWWTVILGHTCFSNGMAIGLASAFWEPQLFLQPWGMCADGTWSNYHPVARGCHSSVSAHLLHSPHAWCDGSRGCRRKVNTEGLSLEQQISWDLQRAKESFASFPCAVLEVAH